VDELDVPPELDKAPNTEFIATKPYTHACTFYNIN